VVVYHYTPESPASGPFMVNGFFVLSGFLFAMEYIKNQTFDVIKFYEKKIKRLMPLFLCAIFIGLILRIAINRPFPDHFSWGDFDIVAFIMYYDTPAWYMAVEFALLLMAPFFFFIMRKKYIVVFTLVMIIFTGWLFSKVRPYSFYADGLYFSPFARSWQFLMGMSAAVLYAKHCNSKLFRGKVGRYLTTVLFIVFFLLSIILMIVKQKLQLNYWNYTFSFTFLSSVLMACLIPLLYSTPIIVVNKIRERLVYFSLLTYPVYLIHVPVLWYISIFFDKMMGLQITWLNLSLSVVLTLVGASVLHNFEKRYVQPFIFGKKDV